MIKDNGVVVIRTFECKTCLRFDSILMTKDELDSKLECREEGMHDISHGNHTRRVFFDNEGNFTRDLVFDGNRIDLEDEDIKYLLTEISTVNKKYAKSRFVLAEFTEDGIKEV